MMDLRTPGVYLREVDIAPPKLVRMSVTGLVGQAERGPLNQPQPLTNWGQFRDIFGDFIGHGYLPYAVFGFFLNGGERCYVVRIAHESAVPAISPRVSACLAGTLSPGATTAALDSIDGIAAGMTLTIADAARALRVAVRSVKAAEKKIDFDDGPPVTCTFSPGAQVIDRPFEVRAINEGQWGNAVVMSVEERSTGDLLLTELDEELAAAGKKVKFKSVAGLIGEDAAGSGKGDRVVLIHRRDPARTELTIESINFLTREVVFTEPSPLGFPPGSGVMARGFKVTFRLIQAGKVVREEVFDNVSLNEEKEHYFVRRINGDPEEKDYVRRIKNGNSILVRVDDLSATSSRARPRPVRLIEQHFSGGLDDPGKAEVRHYTGYDRDAYFRPVPPGAGAEQVKEIEEKFFGLAAFEAVGEVGLVAIPDLMIPDLYAYYAATPAAQVPREGVIFTRFPINMKFDRMKDGQRDLLMHCARMGDRFALLDSPRGAETAKGANKMEGWPGNFQLLPESKNGALYYPWLKQKATDFGGRNLFIPPGGHVAGIYARTERERGVGTAPANEVLRGVVEFEFCLSDAQQSALNPLSVNCLRALPGRGLRVWGARTLGPDPLWRYVNVRRLYLAIVKQILINLQWTVFEPNDARLYDKIKATLRLFLNDLFQSGALAGAKPEDAFFVKCDQENNPPEVVDLGEVITEVGFAPARPAEFILVTIKRTAESVSAREQPR